MINTKGHQNILANPCLPIEEWKNVEGYKGWYEVSNFGRVRSWHNFGHGRAETPRILQPLNRDRNGYLAVGLHVDGNQKSESIHRLVAKAFVPNPNNKPEVNHKLGIKALNWALNLEWATSSENKKHAYKTGLVYRPGERSPHHKLTKDEVLEIRAAHNLGCFTQSELADAYDTDPSNISRIVRHVNWSHL